MFDFLYNILNAKYRLALPSVATVEDIQVVLQQVKYIETSTGSLVDPEIVWGKKEANCVQFASLAIPLLESIGKQPQAVAMTCQNPANNHAITVWTELTELNYFSDANLRQTTFTDIDALVKNIMHDLISWKILS